MIYYGLISDIDAKRGYVKVKIPDLDIVTEFIPYMRQFSQGSSQSVLLTVNELVLVCETYSGRWAVLGSSPNDIDQPYTGASANKLGVKFSDGTLIEYDIQAKKLTIDAPAAEVDITALKVNINALEVNIVAPEIKLTGIVTVSGALIADGGLSLSGAGISVSGPGGIELAGDVIAGGVSLKDHKHSGVSPGVSISGPPLPLP